jgi:hypothetical protein
VHLSQAAALSALAEGLADLFREAVDLLPRMIEAERAGKPLPKRDPAPMASVCAALSFVQDGSRQFITLAHLDGGKVSYQTQETLVWVALDAATRQSIEEQVPGVTQCRVAAVVSESPEGRWRQSGTSRSRCAPEPRNEAD